MTHSMWVGLGVVAFVNVAVALWAYRPFNKTRRLVHGNLENAAQNGYFEPGMYLHDKAAEQIAYDMVCHASDFEGYDPAALVPYVADWMKRLVQ